MAMRDKDRYKRSFLFSAGNEVEVSSDEEGFKGAWYTATIVKSPSSSRTNYPKRKAKALVKYRTLLSDSDRNEPLTEYVEVPFIRPPPPPPKADRTFEPLDVVDAFHRDGWWKGVVSQVETLEDTRKSKSYTVIFENPPEQFCFRTKDLRFHLVWNDGKWIRPPKQKRMEGLNFGKGLAVEVNFDKENLQDAWFPAIVLGEVGFNSFLVEYHSPRNDGDDHLMRETVDSFHIRLPPPMLKDKNFEILDAIDVFHDSCWRDGLITKILTDGRYNVFVKNADREFQFSQSEIRSRLDWVIPNRIQSEEQSAYFDSNAKHSEVVVCIEGSSAALDHIEKKSPRKRSTAAKDQIEEKFSVKRWKKNPLELSTPSTAIITTKKLKNSATVSEETLASFSKRFRKENSANSLFSEECCANLMPMKSTEQEVTDSALANCSTPNLDGNLPSAGSNSPCMGKNNDPCKQGAVLENGTTGPPSPEMREIQMDAQVTSQPIPVTVREDKTNGDPAEVIIEDELKENDSSDLLAERRGSLVENSHHLPSEGINMPKGNDVLVLQKKGEQHNFAEGSASKTGFENCANKEAEMPTAADIEYEGPSTDQTAEEVDITAFGASSEAVNDSQALSTIVEARKNRTIEKFKQSIQVQNVLAKSQETPFAKGSFMWKHVESLEVFQFLPQNPHFSPLYEYKEVMREGLAIGHMLNFAALAEKISRLEVEDPRDLFDSYVQALADLEMLGFDVKAMTDRVNELLSIKNRQEELKNQAKDVEARIAECDSEKAKLEGEIDEIEKMITELEGKRAMKASLKLGKHSEILALQMDVNDINQGILNINQDFEKVAASPW